MSFWMIATAVVTLALVYVAAPVALAAFRQWRRPWRLACPRDGALAQIRVAAPGAALAELVGGRPEIARCSLWPARLDCAQDCLEQAVTTWQPMRPGEAPPRERADGSLRLIVVPLDGTRGDEDVLPAVARLAATSHATVRLLRVVPPAHEIRAEDDRVVAWVDQETEREEREAQRYLRRVAAALPELPVESAVRVGDLATETVAECESVGADLIALAAPRRRGLGRVLRGDVTRQLRRATTIPVLLVPRTDAA